MEKIGRLWTNMSKNGVKYLTGTINGVKVLIFKNKFKQQDKQPSFYVYKSERQNGYYPSQQSYSNSYNPHYQQNNKPFTDWNKLKQKEFPQQQTKNEDLHFSLTDEKDIPF